MTNARFAVLLVTAFLAASGSRAASEDEATPEQRVDALVHEYGVHGRGPGVGVLVVGPKGVLLEKGYGFANLAKRTPITKATTFELASVSKQFTGAAILLLVQQGKVRVGDDVRKHLPELPLYDARHPITVDHLSRHTSGLPAYFDFDVPEPTGERPYTTNEQMLAEFARRKESSPLEFVPGERYEYSNSGYMVLATLVERVSGLSFGAFLAKELFVPFGMKTAWVHESPRVPTAATAIGYTRGDDGWEATWSAPTPERHEAELTVGDGGVWASLDDMAAWDRGLRAGKILKLATLEAALVPGRDAAGRRIPYAMGWDLEFDKEGEVTTLSHSGSWEGFRTYVGHDVARELTVVALSNRRGFEAESFGEAVGEVFQK